MTFREVIIYIAERAERLHKSPSARCVAMLAISLALLATPSTTAQTRRSERSYIRGGVMSSTPPPPPAVDSLAIDSLAVDSLAVVEDMVVDSMAMARVDAPASDSLTLSLLGVAQATDDVVKLRAERNPYFSDSMSLSKVCWAATVLPGFGQIYNKQYWKLPIVYSALAAGTTLFVKETQKYKPLKAQYDELLLENRYYRSDELDALQADMIRSNTRRQLYLGATVASYIYALGDAAVNYATNDVSSVKRATTLATICPGAGQIYNKQYWKVPFVVGGFAAMIYVVDWNNRGYQRFNKAYLLLLDYDNNPDDYPDGPIDEFSGRYSTSYMKSLRDSYRRNRDLSIIMTAGLYILQIIDAHVDAHFQDFDISDDLRMKVEPIVGTTYSPSSNSTTPTFGVGVDVKF